MEEGIKTANETFSSMLALSTSVRISRKYHLGNCIYTRWSPKSLRDHLKSVKNESLWTYYYEQAASSFAINCQQEDRDKKGHLKSCIFLVSENELTLQAIAVIHAQEIRNHPGPDKDN